jgi:Ser-tRNA(Ala) deacylase AlaX
MSTRLVYLDDSYLFDSAATVAAVENVDGNTAVILDQTIFYPQGGGQPADHGSIESGSAVFNVTDVRSADGVVRHFGEFSGSPFVAGQPVALSVDKTRRLLHCRLHSAGHLIDVAVQNAGLKLLPTKGYHFPQGPYVEYEGEISAEARESMVAQLQKEVDSHISQGFNVEVQYAGPDKVESLCGSFPSYLPRDRDARLIKIAPGLFCPCGGTHVKQLQDLGSVAISKIKCKGGTTRISYQVSGE